MYKPETAVKLAASETELLEQTSPFLSYERKDLKLKIECACATEAAYEKKRKWAMELLEKNVKHMYESCSWGWCYKSKLEEIQADWARYIIAYKENKPIAFSMFRFDLDEGCAVLYCYELHVEKSYQGYGIGQHLMTILEYIAKQQNMEKVVLTVFKHNLQGRNFYKKIGYSLDDTSPEEFDTESPHIILSKPVC